MFGEFGLLLLLELLVEIFESCFCSGGPGKLILGSVMVGVEMLGVSSAMSDRSPPMHDFNFFLPTPA